MDISLSGWRVRERERACVFEVHSQGDGIAPVAGEARCSYARLRKQDLRRLKLDKGYYNFRLQLGREEQTT